MRTKAVLFDLDGTLADSLPLIIRTYRKVFDEMNLPWGNGDVIKMIGLPLKTICRRFAGEKQDLFEDLYQLYYHRDHDLYIRLFPGTAAMLDELKKLGIRLGIVTSKGRPGTLRTVDFTGIGRYMDVIVTAHDVSKHKPHPEPLQKALNLLGTGPEESVYVGDSIYDIITGRNAGTRTIGVTWGLGGGDELKSLRPDGLVGNWSELKEYL
ncbi:MAG TPA: HAD-IA family hydrolase [Bacillota bacterium]|nr:HAD-IA family hydrolase [Bacillota bacterium]